MLAVVNGQEVTRQDVEAEQRANTSHADPTALLQVIVSRTLLAQAAHNRHLDGYPGFPSDIARIRSAFLADKFVQSTTKRPHAPTAAEIEMVIASNPYVFARREQLKLDAIKMHASDAASIEGATSLSDAEARLKNLNAPYKHAQQAFDTASLPTALAQQLVNAPLGQMIRVNAGPDLLLATVEDSRPVAETSDEAKAMASNFLIRSDTQRQVTKQVQALANTAKIQYQPGYAPPARKPLQSPAHVTS